MKLIAVDKFGRGNHTVTSIDFRDGQIVCVGVKTEPTDSDQFKTGATADGNVFYDDLEGLSDEQAPFTLQTE